jgi:hypothetical protein
MLWRERAPLSLRSFRYRESHRRKDLRRCPPRGGFGCWTSATVCGSLNNDITRLARARFVKLSGLTTDQTPFRWRGSSGQATEASTSQIQASKQRPGMPTRALLFRNLRNRDLEVMRYESANPRAGYSQAPCPMWAVECGCLVGISTERTAGDDEMVSNNLQRCAKGFAAQRCSAVLSCGRAGASRSREICSQAIRHDKEHKSILATRAGGRIPLYTGVPSGSLSSLRRRRH